MAMLTLKVPDMSCGHCVASIESAVKAVDPGAKVRADLATQTVVVESTSEPGPLTEAIRAAGYSNERLGA
jgi:copper chaperone